MQTKIVGNTLRPYNVVGLNEKNLYSTINNEF